MESYQVQWSAAANVVFWILLLAMDVWVINNLVSQRFSYNSVIDHLKPYLRTKVDVYLWAFIHVWFMALVLLETYSLFTYWAGCFIRCLDAQMLGQTPLGKAWIWALLLSVPSLMLLAVAIALAFSCASLCELSGWTEEYSVQLPTDEEEARLGMDVKESYPVEKAEAN